MSGKGSKRRPGKLGAFEKGYEAIDWSKGKRRIVGVDLATESDRTVAFEIQCDSGGIILSLTENLNTPTI